MSVFPIRSSLNLLGVSILLFLVVVSSAWGENSPDLLQQLTKSNSAISNRGTEFKNACTDKEEWFFGGDQAQYIPAAAREEFEKLLKKERLPFAAFAEVTELAKVFSAMEARTFSYYWLGRAMFSAGLYSDAAETFNALITIEPNSKGLPFQKAAIACMDRIHEIASHLTYNEKALDNLIQFYDPMLISEKDLELLSRAAVHFIFEKVKKGNPKEVEHALLLLEGTGHLENLMRSTWAIQQGEMESAIFYLEKILSDDKVPPEIWRKRNELRILLSRAYYDNDNYERAIFHLQKVEKSSNELVDAITRLSNSYLVKGDLSRAVGTAIVLNSGDFRHTFSPEAFMFMAIGLNENCRYPEAYSAMNEFKRQYFQSYKWLKERKENKGNNSQALYPLAVAALKGKKVDVPKRVISEWLRSPVFITVQKGINTVFESERRLPELEKQVEIALEIANNERTELQEKTKELSEKNASPLQSVFHTRALEESKARIERLIKGKKTWITFLRKYKANAPKERRLATQKIEKYLSRITQRMFSQLKRVIANNELIEAEILSGVSKDIILKNATQSTSEKIKQRAKENANAHEGYGWRASGEALVGIEVWEDELGSLEASIENNCAKKNLATLESE